MDIRYYMKLQNAHGTVNKREKELVKVNRNMTKHFEDTFGTEDVSINGKPSKLMIIKDTDGNTFKKKIKAPKNFKFKLGDYVEWDGQHWLITLVDSDERTWNRGYMYLCTILLRWQNANGEIVERWGYSEDFTKYSTGETGNNVMTLGENQYGITLPVDDETKVMKRGRRFPVDLEDVEPPDIYELTNRKILLNDNHSFDRGGTLIWTLSFTEFNSETDKKVKLENGETVWICDYTPTLPLPEEENPNQSQVLLKITHKGSNSLIAGGNYKQFILRAFDEDGEELSIDSEISWTVTTLAENQDYISYEKLEDNSIKIKASYDDSIIGTQIYLTASVLGQEASLYLDIGGGI